MTPPGPPRSRVILAFAAVYIIWGSTYLAIRFAVETLPPFLMAGVRFLLAGVLMYLWTIRGQGGRPTAANWLPAILVGCLLLGTGNGSVVWAQQYVPSGLAAMLVATVPLWMVILEWIWGGTPPTRRVLGGIALGFVGLGLLVGPSEFLGERQADVISSAVLVLASLSWATGSVVARRLPMPASPLVGTAMQMIAGGIFLVLIGTLAGEWGRLDLAGASARSLLGFAYLVVFGSLIGYTAYVWLLRNVELAKVSTYSYVNPVVAVFLGWSLADEPLTARIVMASAIIVSAVALITAVRRKPLLERPETAAVTPAVIARRSGTES